MAKVTDEVLGHAEDADGIEEYDNPLPDWWLGLFVLSIVFAGIYPIWYHGMEGNTQYARYDREMAEAEVRWPKSDLVAALPDDPETLAAGELIFQQTCASCHKADMTGGIGPNLVDDEWIHGGEPQDVLTVVSEGVSAKGMPAWGAILGPKKVEQVTAFVLSKRGSAPASAAPSSDDDAAAAAVQDPTPADGGSGDVAQVDASKLYTDHCAACHKPDMTGQVGPNLIDAEWLHGGEVEDIRRTITEGVPAKGMIAWGPILEEAEIDALAQFLHDKAQQAAQN